MIILHPDRTMEERPLTTKLADLQALVGGYIEFVRFGDGSAMVVNEEGLLRELPGNPIASYIAAIKGTPCHLVGSVVVLTSTEMDEMEGDDESEDDEDDESEDAS